MCLVSFSKTDSYSSRKKLDGFKSDSPRWAYVEITDSCSHKCAWCYGGFNADLNNHMTIDTFRSILTKCLEIGIEQITLSGGEPTEHPDFMQFATEAAQLFSVNIATHGDWRNVDVMKLKQLGIKQIQFNYQGKTRHDGVHKIDGSFDRQQEAIRSTIESGIDSVCTVTVGAYNLHDVDNIFSEIDALGATRIRVWEATGLGTPFMKNKETVEIFEACKKSAAKLGYNFIHSYEPEFDGDVSLNCLSLDKMFIYIDKIGKIKFCGAAVKVTDEIADFNTQSSEEILKNYCDFMDSMKRDKPYCAARL